uniref:DJ-1/PfpI domain-containing protein n=1 Tax=Equus caballus TaxID=9796 RepID=A0A9L0SH61_HORSE
MESKAGKKVKIFAPNAKQMHIVNHLKGSPTEEKRNVLEETARSTRGDIQDLANLNFSELDAVIIPGGMRRAATILRPQGSGNHSGGLPVSGTFQCRNHL